MASLWATQPVFPSDAANHKATNLFPIGYLWGEHSLCCLAVTGHERCAITRRYLETPLLTLTFLLILECFMPLRLHWTICFYIVFFLIDV
uniref:Uncharacterized protein n=1 Tax=Pyxicephalus adspersus TaxID=30357 RepID=A0AAV3AXN7_PYXAD|nr:TPA: hypothetical protein GDO54_005952 [Pyxicephalus adspersus]